jgi:hypothetical protein
MYLSINMLSNTVANHKKSTTKDDTTTNIMMVVSILFVAIEFIMLYYAVSIAISCSQVGSERAVHMGLSIFFTMPYLLFMSVFSKCASTTLKSGVSQSWAEGHSGSP